MDILASRFNNICCQIQDPPASDALIILWSEFITFISSAQENQTREENGPEERGGPLSSSPAGQSAISMPSLPSGFSVWAFIGVAIESQVLKDGGIFQCFPYLAIDKKSFLQKDLLSHLNTATSTPEETLCTAFWSHWIIMREGYRGGPQGAGPRKLCQHPITWGYTPGITSNHHI